MNRSVVNFLDFIARANPDYVEGLYRQYKSDPKSVDERWALVFAGYEFASQNGAVVAPEGAPALRVADLVDAYRNFGHLIADLDPLGHSPRSHPYLELERFGLGADDLGRTVSSGSFRGLSDVPFGELIEALRETYCGTLGVELIDIRDKQQRDWLEDHMEGCRNRPEPGERGTSAHPRAAGRGRDVRAILGNQVRRPEALLARGRGEL